MNFRLQALEMEMNDKVKQLNQKSGIFSQYPAQYLAEQLEQHRATLEEKQIQILTLQQSVNNLEVKLTKTEEKWQIAEENCLGAKQQLEERKRVERLEETRHRLTEENNSLVQEQVRVLRSQNAYILYCCKRDHPTTWRRIVEALEANPDALATECQADMSSALVNHFKSTLKHLQLSKQSQTDIRDVKYKFRRMKECTYGDVVDIHKLPEVNTAS